MPDEIGIDCPECGFAVADQLDRQANIGRYPKTGRTVRVTITRARCGFCGHEWTDRDVEPLDDHAVLYRPMRCPSCNGSRCRVTKTAGATRYHKCGDCSHRFKSIEAAD